MCPHVVPQPRLGAGLSNTVHEGNEDIMGWFRGMKRKKFDFGEVHIPVDVSIPRISISFGNFLDPRDKLRPRMGKRDAGLKRGTLAQTLGTVQTLCSSRRPDPGGAGRGRGPGEGGAGRAAGLAPPLRQPD